MQSVPHKNSVLLASGNEENLISYCKSGELNVTKVLPERKIAFTKIVESVFSVDVI